MDMYRVRHDVHAGTPVESSLPLTHEPPVISERPLMSEPFIGRPDVRPSIDEPAPWIGAEVDDSLESSPAFHPRAPETKHAFDIDSQLAERRRQLPESARSDWAPTAASEPQVVENSLSGPSPRYHQPTEKTPSPSSYPTRYQPPREQTKAAEGRRLPPVQFGAADLQQGPRTERPSTAKPDAVKEGERPVEEDRAEAKPAETGEAERPVEEDRAEAKPAELDEGERLAEAVAQTADAEIRPGKAAEVASVQELNPTERPEAPTRLSDVRKYLSRPAVIETEASQREFLREMAVVKARMIRIADLVERVVQLPLVNQREQLHAKMIKLAQTDIRACLRQITRTCTELGVPDLAAESDPDLWLDLLQTAVTVLERRGAPEIAVLPAPDGSIEGARARRPVRDLAVRDSRAITYGVGNSLHVVHDCRVDSPVIEVADLLHYDKTGDIETWQHSVEPVRTAATDDFDAVITRSSGISIGTGNHQRSVFTHQIGPCPVNLGAVVAIPRVRAAILAYRQSSDEARAAAWEALETAVRHSVNATDVSVLVPDSLIRRTAAAQMRSPAMRGAGVRLTIRHGAGVSVGWDSEITSETRTRVGKPEVRS